MPEVNEKVEIVPALVPAVTVALVPERMFVPSNFTLKIRLVPLSLVEVVK